MQKSSRSSVAPRPTRSRSAALCPPWGSVLCHETAHILQSECGATSMFGGGAIMRGVGGDSFRIGGRRAARSLRRDAMGRPAPLAAIGAVADDSERPRHAVHTAAGRRARRRSLVSVGLRAHLDGARIANAFAALGCSPADLTWRAGIDALSLGATKNGVLSTDAIVCFDPDDLRATGLPRRSGPVTWPRRCGSNRCS